MTARNLAEGGCIVDAADLVVHLHQRYQQSVVAQGCGQLFWLNDATGIRAQIGHLKAFTFQLLAAVEYGLVLNDRGDQVTATLTSGLRYALDRQVIGFGRP